MESLAVFVLASSEFVFQFQARFFGLIIPLLLLISLLLTLFGSNLFDSIFKLLQFDGFLLRRSTVRYSLRLSLSRCFAAETRLLFDPLRRRRKGNGQI